MDEQTINLKILKNIDRNLNSATRCARSRRPDLEFVETKWRHQAQSNHEGNEPKPKKEKKEKKEKKPRREPDTSSYTFSAVYSIFTDAAADTTIVGLVSTAVEGWTSR